MAIRYIRFNHSFTSICFIRRGQFVQEFLQNHVQLLAKFRLELVREQLRQVRQHFEAVQSDHFVVAQSHQQRTHRRI